MVLAEGPFESYRKGSMDELGDYEGKRGVSLSLQLLLSILLTFPLYYLIPILLNPSSSLLLPVLFSLLL